jgi:hypothetical protein
MPDMSTSMSEVTDTRKMTARPGCCGRADRYIRIHEPDPLHGPDHQGWAITLQGQYDASRENIKFCPWCGKAVPAS